MTLWADILVLFLILGGKCQSFFFLLSSMFSSGSLKMSFTKPSVSRNSLWIFVVVVLFLSQRILDFCQIVHLCPAFWSSVSKIYYFKWLRIRYWHFCYRILSSNSRLYDFLHMFWSLLSCAYFYNMHTALRSWLFRNNKLSCLLYKCLSTRLCPSVSCMQSRVLVKHLQPNAVTSWVTLTLSSVSWRSLFFFKSSLKFLFIGMFNV